ncbi:hypothetical protein P3T86_09735 [Staphylococcus nepalensis]|uniref:hypothetical protein n=1 Tax=Staphylococcus nepalensis TaxID=214473 RepID=UPI002B25AE66|nr:hypothetical protein [Staphylococcus nepalensis]WQL19467.1 hypothetical protein P3T86_09735 [Staphylococcus nepalensis]
MQDIMMYLYDTFLDDQLISKHVKADSIKFYSYPNANDIQNTVIVIDELISPKMSDFADDDPLTYEYIFQVDIFVKQNKNNVNGSLLSRELILRVARIMWDLGFGEFQSFNPTYEENFNLYRQSKQFRGRKYIKEMEQ